MEPAQPVAADRAGRRPGAVAAHVATDPSRSPTTLLARLRSACADVTTDAAARAEASRDWWPLAMPWALDGQVAGAGRGRVPAGDRRRGGRRARASATRPGCPVTAAGGPQRRVRRQRPGVRRRRARPDRRCQGIVAVDDASLIVDVLRRHVRAPPRGRAAGRPRSHPRALAAVDRAVDGRRLAGVPVGRPVLDALRQDRGHGDRARRRAGRRPADHDRRAAPPGRRPRPHPAVRRHRRHARRHHRGPPAGPPVPPAEARAAYGFPTFAAGIDACRRILRRGATPAVLRLYDEAESARSHGTDGDVNVLLVLDEADAAARRRHDGDRRGRVRRAPSASTTRWSSRWLDHRNDVSALEALTAKGFVVDTMEIAAPWSRLDADLRRARSPPCWRCRTRCAATAHLSHSYPDGACLYFTFAATPPADEREATYVALWDAGTRAVLGAGGSLSHHHGVGLNRARFVRRGPRAGLRRARRRPSRRSTRTASSTRASSGCRRRSARCRGRAVAVRRPRSGRGMISS